MLLLVRSETDVTFKRVIRTATRRSASSADMGGMLFSASIVAAATSSRIDRGAGGIACLSAGTLPAVSGAVGTAAVIAASGVLRMVGSGVLGEGRESGIRDGTFSRFAALTVGVVVFAPRPSSAWGGGLLFAACDDFARVVADLVRNDISFNGGLAAFRS
jgi:hypothetical protein